MSRRKLKKERELVTDIKERFRIECSKYISCKRDCPYHSEEEPCIMRYLRYLLSLDEDENE